MGRIPLAAACSKQQRGPIFKEGAVGNHYFGEFIEDAIFLARPFSPTAVPGRFWVACACEYVAVGIISSSDRKGSFSRGGKKGRVGHAVARWDVLLFIV